MKLLHNLKRRIGYYIGRRDFVFYNEFKVVDQELYETCFEIGDMLLYLVDGKGTKSGMTYYYSSYTNLIDAA